MERMSYFAPKNVDDAIEVLQKSKGRARVIAGGTNFIPDMRSGVVAPEVVVDLSGLGDLPHIKEEKGTISVGAMVSMSEIAACEIIRNHSPILSLAANRLGNALTRNRATIGGNLAHASPAADMAPPLLALDASVHTKRGGGKGRKIAIDQFFVGPNQTVLEEDEIITQIAFAKAKDPARASHVKLGLRDSMAISVVSLAVILEMDGTVCQKARIAFGAVAPKPIRAYRVEELLSGKTIDSKAIDECAAIVEAEISPISDIRASAEYRRLVVPVLLKRAIQEALA